MISDKEKDVGYNCGNSVGNKWKDKRGFLVIRFSFLVGIASVVSLLRNDRKKEKYKIQDAGYFFES